MREIKFRGQRADNKEWISGDLCKSISGTPCIMPSAFFATREFEEQEEDKPQLISDSLAIGGFYPVIPETVGQYTGLKDKNGVEIYEWDIVTYLTENKGCFELEECEQVVFEQGAWRALYPLYLAQSIEINGNIHENPELLK